jgi:hypothetical protein
MRSRRVVRISAFCVENAVIPRPRTCGLPKGRTRFLARAVFGVLRHDSSPFEDRALISLIENQNNQRSGLVFRPLRRAALACRAPPPSIRFANGGGKIGRTTPFLPREAAGGVREHEARSGRRGHRRPLVSLAHSGDRASNARSARGGWAETKTPRMRSAAEAHEFT